MPVDSAGCLSSSVKKYLLLRCLLNSGTFMQKLLNKSFVGNSSNHFESFKFFQSGEFSAGEIVSQKWNEHQSNR